jgi:hypothetical protein
LLRSNMQSVATWPKMTALKLQPPAIPGQTPRTFRSSLLLPDFSPELRQT